MSAQNIFPARASAVSQPSRRPRRSTASHTSSTRITAARLHAPVWPQLQPLQRCQAPDTAPRSWRRTGDVRRCVSLESRRKRNGRPSTG
jgi:hypothetical protein